MDISMHCHQQKINRHVHDRALDPNQANVADADLATMRAALEEHAHVRDVT